MAPLCTLVAASSTCPYLEIAVGLDVRSMQGMPKRPSRLAGRTQTWTDLVTSKREDWHCSSPPRRPFTFRLRQKGGRRTARALRAGRRNRRTRAALKLTRRGGACSSIGDARIGRGNWSTRYFFHAWPGPSDDAPIGRCGDTYRRVLRAPGSADGYEECIGNGGRPSEVTGPTTFVPGLDLWHRATRSWRRTNSGRFDRLNASTSNFRKPGCRAQGSSDPDPPATIVGVISRQHRGCSAAVPSQRQHSPAWDRVYASA